MLTTALAALAAAALTACSAGGGSSLDSNLGVSASPRVADGRAIPKGGGIYKVGRPYRVAGRWYHPHENPNYDRVGTASWYGTAFHGRRTSNGEIYNMYAMTAGHPTLPMPSYAYVTNLQNGRTALVRINDRGPYARDRLIGPDQQAGGTGRHHGRGDHAVVAQHAFDHEQVVESRVLGSPGQIHGLAVTEAETPQRDSEVPHTCVSCRGR